MKWRKAPAGRWQTAVVLLLVVGVLLALLGCEVVQKFAEPIDEAGCKVDCRACEFARYDYQGHHCYCICDGIEVQLY